MIIKYTYVVISKNGIDEWCGKCLRHTNTSFWAGGIRFSQKSLTEVGGGPRIARQIEEADVARINQEIEERRKRKNELINQELSRKAQIEYEALPEEIKLARTICFFCDNMGEKGLSKANIDLLRQLADWVKSQTRSNQQ